MNRGSLSGVLVLCSLLLAATGCRQRQRPVRKSWLTMGTFASVTVPADDARRLEKALPAVTNRAAAIAADLTVYNPESDVSRLNAAAGEPAFRPVSPHTLRMIEASRRIASLTDGAFDPTVGPLAEMWGFNTGTPPQRLPASERIARVLARIGLQHVAVSNGMARIRAPGVALDFGGIAKGYGVDLCYEELRNAGIENVMVNIGGNLRVGGQPEESRPWRIGVRDPFDNNRLLGTLSLCDGDAVATSGHYERFVTIEGRRYAHIIDPRTGLPVEGMAGVTVVAPTGVEADGLSTALFVLGPDGLSAVLARRPGLCAALVPNARPRALVATPAFLDRFQPAPRMRNRIRRAPRGEARLPAPPAVVPRPVP